MHAGPHEVCMLFLILFLIMGSAKATIFFRKVDSQTFSYKLGFESFKTAFTDGPGVFRIET